MKLAIVPITILFLVWMVMLIVVAARLVLALLRYLRARTKVLEREAERKKQPPAEPLPLPEQLRRQRESRGLTQEAVAASLNISRQAVSKWENGDAEPSTANLLALADLYGVSVDELLRSRAK